MKNRILHTRKAELTAMLIVISVIAIMGAGAFILGGGITGLQVRDNTTDEVVSAWATTNVNAGFTCPYDASTTGERYLFRSGVTTCETTQDAITIDANDITIECEDGARFVGAGNGVGIVSYSYSNVKIINCDISGFATGIFVSTGDDWSIEDNNIHDIEGWGISFYGTDDSNITRNSLDDFYSGSGAANSIRIISYSNDNNISFNTFSGRMNSGIYFSESSTNYVTSNTFSPSPEHSAVRIDENSDHIYVSYNDFLTTGAANGAVYVEGDYSHIWLNNFYSQDITISGTTNYELCGLESNDVMQNTFGNYYGDSLSAPSGACDPQYKATLPEPYDPEEGLPLLCGATVLGPITLTEDLQDQDPDTSDQQCLGNGLIIGADNVFIDCGESDNFQITGNDEDNDFGIGPDGDYDNLEIRNCDVSGFGHGYSSDIYTTTGTINVHHNIFHDNVYGGVDAENFDDDVAISNNEIYSNGNVGIWVAGTPNTQVIDNNQIRENGGYGLYIDAASSEITDNEIYGNLDGIYVNNRDYTRIEDNNIYDNTNNGIDVFSDTSSVTNTLIGRNTLNNTGTGFDLVWNLGDSTNHIYLNHFYGNGVDDSFSNDYCVDGGNFYRHDMPTVRIGTDDCGPSEIECPVLGTPTFNEWSATQHEITTSTRYFDVEIADFNNDGYDDVVATLDSGGLHLWRNSGSGFSLVDLVGSVHYHVAVGDLNGDDLVDIVAADNTNGIFWWRNNGFSDFTEIGLSPSPESANAVEIADMNNDGLLDIVVGYTSGVDLVWFENQGGEQFNQHPISSSLQFLGDIALADLNSDGYMDIVCAERSANQIVWFRSNAGLTFTEDSMPTSFDYPDSVYVYDLNNDGHMDIVAASSVEDHISWWENFGIGNFGGENILTPDVAISYGVAAYDLDSDGDNDVIAASRSSPHLVWWENREGAFHQHTIDDTLTSRDRLALGDMNNDGDIDVVAVAESNDGIYWWSLVEPNITSGPNRCPSTVLPIGNPPEGMVENTFYNISEINITWTEQDHSPALPITYAVDIIDGLETTLLGTIDTLLMSWDVSGVMESHEYDVAVTPNDGTVNGTIAPSDTFSISNDADNDGYSVLTQFQESDSWDCDDQNIDIHQPVSRENITEAGLCYNTVEDDCDGLTDWLDTGCGNSFTPGSFDDTIYIDGSIIDIETCELATGGYLALIDNPYGKVEYFTPTNLSGVNLDAIFDIDHNSIDVDPTATNGDRFNKQATVTFYNLDEYEKIPIILVDGVPCPPEVCTNQYPNNGPANTEFGAFGYDVSFNAAHFSTFTTTTNSNLITFHQNDAEAAVVSTLFPLEMENYHRLRFYANYSRFPDNTPINTDTGGYADVNHNGSCNITLYKPDGSIIRRDDYELFREDFNNGYPIRWNTTGCVNASPEYMTPVENIVMNLFMNNTACSNPNISYFEAKEVLPDTTNLFFNLTFMAKSNESGRWLNFSIVENGGNEEIISKNVSLTTEWVAYELSGAFDNNGGNATISFNITSNNDGDFTVYLDNIRILSNATGEMEYDEYYGVYWYESSVNDFPAASDYYDYDISCASDIYEPISSSDQFSVVSDTTEPVRPTLYPQILKYPSNLTEEKYTYVAGYFGESDIDYTLMVLHGYWTYNFTGTTFGSDIHSEFKGDDIVVNFATISGQNVSFTAWDPNIERALKEFKYVEFSNHNRSYFNRYEIARANRTGDDIRIEFYEELDVNVPIGAYIRLYTAPHPPGYFIKRVNLFGGSNRITAWGYDTAGNPGFASEDWISAPYPDTAPKAPILWPLPYAIRSDTNLSVSGFVDEVSMAGINMTMNVIQDDYFNTTWLHPSPTFNVSHEESSAFLSQDREFNRSFIYISYFDLLRINDSVALNDSWVSFSNHNRTLWQRYNVTDYEKNPGEDARVYISPNLEYPVQTGETISFHDNEWVNGFFSMDVDNDSLRPGMNRIYAVPFRLTTEGYPSESQYVYNDAESPEISIQQPLVYNTRNPTFIINISDDYMLNFSSLVIWINDSSNQDFNYSYMDISGNGSFYSVFWNHPIAIENGTYNGSQINITDAAGWQTSLIFNYTVQITTVDIIEVLDEDDITNDLWLYFNWTRSGGDFGNYDFALGTQPWPNADFNSIKPWTSMCDLSNCSQDWINFTHDSNTSDINITELKMNTGTVYYLTVRARNFAGDYGNNVSSDGILFIDQTPPAMIEVDGHGPWWNSRTQLRGDWLFQDDESDIIEYMYAIGTARYPDAGYASVVSPTLTPFNSIVQSDLNLVENETYFFNVKARNGNLGANYSGGWSPWYSSESIQIDTLPPYNGSIYWSNLTTYTTSGFVTVHIDPGTDDGSDNVKSLIQLGRGPLIMDSCPSISDFDWHDADNILSGPQAVDVNVTTGHCYVFRLYSWDNASNGVVYHTTNETLKIVKADETNPSDVAPVVDDGFYTNSRSSLHADWVVSFDGESGFDRYYWRIVEQPVTGLNICYVNASGTNCSEEAAGHAFASEVSISNLNLTHNHKYYFEVYASDRAGRNSTARYSDGIIYIDAAPPKPLVVYTVNEDNESSSPYITRVSNGEINITAYGDLDGYYDTAQCMLMAADLDYIEDTSLSTVLSTCDIRRVSSTINGFAEALTNYTPKIITEVSCSNVTNYAGGPLLQQVYTWHLSCRDHYWNTQDFAQNGDVEFEVDWYERPDVDVVLFGTGIEVYSDDDITCRAVVSDPENDFNSTVRIEWFRNDVPILSYYDNVSLVSGDYVVDSILPNSRTFRGDNITCYVNASDVTGLYNRSGDSLIVSNSPPHTPFDLIYPSGSVVNGLAEMVWTGPYDAVDSDSLTLLIEIENTSSFNRTDNAPLSFEPSQSLRVEGLLLPGTQQNSDVYKTMVVYEDNRSGNWDIYLYDMEDGTERSLVSSVIDQFNPQVYGRYVVYEQDNTGTSIIYAFNLETFVTSMIADSVNTGSMDFFGDYIAYNDGGGVRYSTLDGDEVGTGLPMPTAEDISIYGNTVVWRNSIDSHIWMYEINMNKTPVDTGFIGTPIIFGWLLAIDDGVNITVKDLITNITIDSFAGSDPSLFGNLVSYVSAGINVRDVFTGSVESLGAGSSPSVNENLLVFNNADDLDYANRTFVLPASLILDNLHEWNYHHFMDTLNSEDREYMWRVAGCDSAFDNNSCVYASAAFGAKSANFTIDNTAPNITSISPSDRSIVAGEFRIHANVVDNRGYETVAAVNYTILYDNGSLRSSGSMNRSGSVWRSNWLNFLDIQDENFTLGISARDENYNWNHSLSVFTVNNDTAWFLFGTGDDEIIDGETAFDTVINSNFIAFNVLNSNIEIRGPNPATTIRFVNSMSDLTISMHNYSDPISTLTWPRGIYTVNMTGINLDGTNRAGISFYIDHDTPVWSDPVPHLTTRNASQPLVMSINWSDYTIRNINFTYNNTNRSKPTPESQVISTTSGGVFTTSPIDVKSHINKTFNWWSSGTDAAGKFNTTSLFEIFIESDQPQFTGTVPDISLNEDGFIVPMMYNLSNYFSDPNTVGTWGHLDSLTYSAHYNTSILDVIINSTTGKVMMVFAINDFNGDTNIIFNATDRYGKTQQSNTVAVHVAPMPDAPEIRNSSGDPIPNITIAEDNFTEVRINLTEFGFDVDNDVLTWLTPVISDTSMISSSWDPVNYIFNFTVVPDRFGTLTVMFTVRDSTSLSVSQVMVINITPEPDAPTAPVIVNPALSVTYKGDVRISWIPSTDADGDSINYSIEYSLDGINWNSIVGPVVTSMFYDWDSTVIDEEPVVMLRVNATDSTLMSSSTHGNFSIDNLAPIITVNRPDLVMVGLGFNTDIISHEPATCSFSVNKSANVAPSTTVMQTSHVVALSNLVYNTTYALQMVCRDAIGNSNTTIKMFQPRATPLEFVSAYATPSWVYQNQPINITLVIASNDSLQAGSMFTEKPDGNTNNLNYPTNFAPVIDENNMETSLTVAVDTDVIGLYNLSITSLTNVHMSITNILVEDIYEVFIPVNQTLNII